MILLLFKYCDDGGQLHQFPADINFFGFWRYESGDAVWKIAKLICESGVAYGCVIFVVEHVSFIQQYSPF